MTITGGAIRLLFCKPISERTGFPQPLPSLSSFWKTPQPRAPPFPPFSFPYYDELIDKGSIAESLEAFKAIVTENPTKAGCARAYYWLALDAYRRADKNSIALNIDLLRKSNVNTEITFEKWQLEAKALLLLANLKESAVPRQAVNFYEAFIASAKLKLERDIATIEN